MFWPIHRALTEELTRNGGKALAVETDVTQQEQAQRLVDAAVNGYGRIDVILDNAGPMPSSPLDV